MIIDGLANIKKAIGTLNPHEIRESSERSLRIVLHAPNSEAYSRLENFFLQDLSPARRRRSAMQLIRAPLSPGAPPADLHIYDESEPAVGEWPVFHAAHPQQFVQVALKRFPQFGVPLAKSFLPFRKPFVERVITRTSRENAMFSIATALDRKSTRLNSSH